MTPESESESAATARSGGSAHNLGSGDVMGDVLRLVFVNLLESSNSHLAVAQHGELREGGGRHRHLLIRHANFLRAVAEACSPQRFREENAVVRFISRS